MNRRSLPSKHSPGSLPRIQAWRGAAPSGGPIACDGGTREPRLERLCDADALDRIEDALSAASQELERAATIAAAIPTILAGKRNFESLLRQIGQQLYYVADERAGL